MTAQTIHVRLQSSPAKCCRLLITNTLSGGIWFAVIGLQPERGERPLVTEILLNKQASISPKLKVTTALLLHLS